MIDKERIKKEADSFFEWPTQNKDHVSTVSMLIFSNVIREMAVAEEREACAKLCDEIANNTETDDFALDSVNAAAAEIRKRSNV